MHFSGLKIHPGDPENVFPGYDWMSREYFSG